MNDPIEELAEHFKHWQDSIPPPEDDPEKWNKFVKLNVSLHTGDELKKISLTGYICWNESFEAYVFKNVKVDDRTKTYSPATTLFSEEEWLSVSRVILDKFKVIFTSGIVYKERQSTPKTLN